MKRLISFVTAIAIILSIFCFQVSAQKVSNTNNVAYHLYVSVSGSDVTGDGTEEKPFASI